MEGLGEYPGLGFPAFEPCEARPPCPGCPRYGDIGLSSDALTRLSAFGARSRLNVVAHSARPLGYRHRVRLSVRSVRGLPRLGIFEERSHRLVPIARCPLHHSAIVLVSEAIERFMHAAGVPAYDEARHAGLVRAVQLCAARAGSGPQAGRVQVTFIVKDLGALCPKPGSPFHRVLTEVSALKEVQSVWTNAQTLPTNTLLGPEFALFSGERFLEQTCALAQNYFHPGAFGQSNPELHEEVVRTISRFVPEAARVVEFHAGVGSIGLSLVAPSEVQRTLVANEISPYGLEGLERGARALAHPERVSVCAGPASANASLVQGADVVIVDPPRKGLEPELLRALVETRPARLIYLSCGLDALLSEAEVLEGAHYRPIYLGAYPYFPFTDHVETLAVFDQLTPPHPSTP